MGNDRKNFEFVLDNNFKAGFSKKIFGNFKIDENSDFFEVLQNRKNLANFLKINFKNLIFMNQIHQDEICLVDEKFLENFYQKQNNFFKNLENNQTLKDDFLKIFPICDALISNLKQIYLCVMVADCSPILVINKNCFAAIHAGREGIIRQILTKTILKMEKIFNLKRLDFEIFVGPNIKQNCYEIGNLKIPNFENFIKDKKFSQDLALLDEIRNLGITKYHFSDICTKCNDEFFSYRKDKKCGRFVGFIGLNS